MNIYYAKEQKNDNKNRFERMAETERLDALECVSCGLSITTISRHAKGQNHISMHAHTKSVRDTSNSRFIKFVLHRISSRFEPRATPCTSTKRQTV